MRNEEYTRGAKGRQKKRRQNKEEGKKAEKGSSAALSAQRHRAGNSVYMRSSFSTSASISSPGILLSGRLPRKSLGVFCIRGQLSAPSPTPEGCAGANLFRAGGAAPEREKEAIHHWFGLSRSHHLAQGRATKMDDTPRWAEPHCFWCTPKTPTHPLATAPGAMQICGICSPAWPQMKISTTSFRENDLVLAKKLSVSKLWDLEILSVPFKDTNYWKGLLYNLVNVNCFFYNSVCCGFV